MRYALVALVFLAGCQSVDRNIAIKTELAQIPDELLKECADLFEIPMADLKSRLIARGWQQDRNNFRICANRHKGLARAYREIARIQGK